MAPSRWGFPVAQAMQRHTGSRLTPSPPLQPALPAAPATAVESDLPAVKDDEPDATKAKPLARHIPG